MIKTTPYSRRDEKWDLPVIQVKSKEEKMRLHLISSRTDSAESSRWSARSSGAAVPSFRDQVMVQKALRDDLISNSIRIKYKNIGIFQI